MATTQERELLIEFIEVYRNNPCLWDMSTDMYRHKGMKHEAWVVLTEVLKKMDADANVATTKKKVENLRAVYFRELKKVRSSRLIATDEREVYVPNLWYFKLISFLDRDDWGPCRRAWDPLQSVSMDGDVKQAPQSDEESMESAEMLEAVTEEESLHSLPTKRKWPTNSNNPQKFKRSEINHTHTMETFVESLSYTEPQTLQDTTKKTNSFSVYVGEQLEQISSFQRDVAEKLISEVLFLAKTGNLNYDSKIETPSKLLNTQSNAYVSPEYNIILPSPRKLEVESVNERSEESEASRTLLKELLTEKKQN